MTARTTYSRLQIALHWLVALLIIATWFLGDGMGRVWRNRIESGQSGLEGNTLHVWLGMAVFALVLLRLVVRLIQGAPAPVPGTPKLLELTTHWGSPSALYADAAGSSRRHDRLVSGAAG